MQQPIVHANEMQMLRNKTKARGDNSLNFYTKLSETSPPMASIAKMGEKLRRPKIKSVPPKVVYFSTREWNAIHISNCQYLEQDKLY